MLSIFCFYVELYKKCNGFVEKEIVDPVTGKLTIISNGCHGCGGALKEIILEPVGGGGDFDIRQEGFRFPWVMKYDS